jgi:hypothetical protein
MQSFQEEKCLSNLSMTSVQCVGYVGIQASEDKGAPVLDLEYNQGNEGVWSRRVAKASLVINQIMVIHI